jgi:hypothetical protein
MKRFFLVSFGVCVFLLAAWFTPWVQQWKDGAIERAYIRHYDSKHVASEHDHYYDQEVWPESEAVPETLFVDRGGRTVFRVGEDTIRVNMDEWPEEDFGHEHFGVNTDSVMAMLQDEHLLDTVLDHANTLAVIITVLGTAVANIYWKFRRGPST